MTLLTYVSRQRGVIAVALVGVFAPLLLWSRQIIPQALFASTYNTITTVLQVAALAGISLFATNIFLSARYRFVDWLFFGLDRAYRVHRRTGLTAFVLLSLHVLLVTIRAYLVSLAELMRTWLDVNNPALIAGRLAFLGLAAVVTITLVRKLTYERLKLIHQTLGVFLFLGGVHAYLIPSDVAVNQPLRWYILSLVGLGVGSYIYRTLLKRLLIARRPFTVVAVNRLSSEVTEVIMEPQDGRPVTFMPGQFNFHRFIQPGFPDEDHPFSITAGAQEGRLRISAKALGDFTARLPALTAGATAYIQGPFGGFSYRRAASRRQIWVAGGIGITPFISMARTLRSSGDAGRYHIDLFYSVKTADQFVYRQELTDIAAALPTLRLHFWTTDTQGLLTAKTIAKAADVRRSDILLCGPPPMLAALRKQLRTMGIPPARIHYELFKLL